MIRFALIVASTLGFVLTAAMGNLMVPLLRAFQSRQQPTHPPEPERPDAAPSPDPDEAPERPAQPPTMGGLCLMVGVLAAVGVGWTAACVAEPQLLGTEGLLSTRLLVALIGALLFGGGARAARRPHKYPSSRQGPSAVAIPSPRRISP